jgi:dihydrofolate reductase
VRDVVLQISAMSIDGVVTAEDSEALDLIDVPDDERDAWMVSQLRSAGVHAMGRVTYESMAEHWPTSTEVFAEPMNAIPKAVFSSTLEEAAWPESTIIAGDLGDGLARLKEVPGDPIVVHGGIRFATAVAATGLVDVLRLCVHPYIDGGRGIFAGTTGPAGLALVEATPFPTGSVGLEYRHR